MQPTRKNRVICYTGINSRKNGKHSIKNFRKITRKLYSKSKCKSIKKKSGSGDECPKNTNNNGWIDFFGAEHTTPEECNSIMKNNEKINAQREKLRAQRS